MARRMVERSEVVIVEFHLGPLHHAVAEADEDVLDLPLRADQRVERAGRDRRRSGQGDVDRVLGQPAAQLTGVELRAAALEQRLELLARLVAGLADRPALVLGQLGDPTEDLRELGLAAQVADPKLLQLGGTAGRADCLGRLLSQLFDPLNHSLLRLRHKTGCSSASPAEHPRISAEVRSPPPRRR